MPVATFQVGQEVHIKPEFEDSWPARAQIHGATFVVVEAPGGRRTSYVLRHANAIAGVRGIRAKEEHLVAGAHPGVSQVPLAPMLLNGTVVQYKDGAQPGLWVVTGYTAKGHQIYPLGGSGVGRKNVSGLRLDVVTLEF